MKKYDVILLDADDTLLDFERTSTLILEKIFDKLGYEYTEKMQKEFKSINDFLWAEYQEGRMDIEEVLTTRFEKLFSVINVNVVGSEVEAMFRELLGHGHELIDGALDLCKKLSEEFDIYIVSNGIKKTQAQRLKDSGLIYTMKEVFVSESVGYQKPQIEFFEYVFKKIPNVPKSKMLVVGDSLSSDIKGGNRAGIDTCWYNPKKKSNNSDIAPTYEIQKLEELFDIL
ncbi:MAG: YjjG family noncanonical pyrimidine nucleotidase [Oscillospiraceae bacterium]|nr:YjjG family noncanonical pyrimidine nucleotidase [Oscillospiraceae bacterium]